MRLNVLGTFFENDHKVVLGIRWSMGNARAAILRRQGFARFCPKRYDRISTE